MTAALSARSLLGAGRVRAVYIIEGGAKLSSARWGPVGSPRALPGAGPGAVGFCTEPVAGEARGRVRVAARPCRWLEGETILYRTGIAAGGDRKGDSVTRHGSFVLRRERGNGFKGVRPAAPSRRGRGVSAGNFLRAFFSWYFLVCNDENEAPVAQSLTWRVFPSGVSSPQVTESAYTGCVRLCAAAQRLFKRISCRAFLRAPQARRRGGFLTQSSRTTRGRQPLFPRPAARGPCGSVPPATLIGVFVYTSGTRAGRGCPAPLAVPRPAPVTSRAAGRGRVSTGPVDFGVRGGPTRRAEIAVPGSCGRDSPGLLW